MARINDDFSHYGNIISDDTVICFLLIREMSFC